MTELLRAVRAEIDATLQDDHTNAERVALQRGQRTGGSDDAREYVFACRTWKDAFTGRDLLIRPGRGREAWEPAQARKLPDGKVLVTTAADLGSAVQGATLIEDETASLDLLAQKLESAGGKGGPIDPTSAGWLVGRGRPRVDRCRTPEQFVAGYRDLSLNPRQRRAIEQALASEVTFIWGPPGTGKTDVVTSVVEGCHRQGLRVLFVAPTHVAVDQALLRICATLESEEGFADGLVQRAGDIAVEALARKYGERISPERLIARLSSRLDEQIGLRSRQLAQISEPLALHAELGTLQVLWNELVQRAAAAQSTVMRSEAAIRTEGAAAEDLVRAINETPEPGRLFHQRRQVKLDELHRQYAQRRQAEQMAMQRRAAAQAEERRVTAEARGVKTRLDLLKARLEGQPPAAQLQQFADQIEADLKELQAERGKVPDAVRARCRILGTTVAKAVQSRRLLDEVDVVVLDEAGMVDLPSAWLTAGLARRRVVLAGDFRQLPAVTRGSDSRTASKDDKAHSRLWMDRDVFHAAGLVDASGRVRTDDRLVALNEQYRMRPAICTLVNEVAYPDSPLLTGRDDTSRLPPSPLIDGALVLIDTSSRQIGSGGQKAHLSNPVHEAVIHELIRGLQYDTVLPARKQDGVRPTERMAVISPYAAQKHALKGSLKYRFGEEYEGLVDTVHRFQGSQRPLVVIDTVAGAGRRPGYFYEGTGLASHTCRLLNVALSRAQDHLVVVANVDYLRGELPPGGEAVRMLDRLERFAQRVPVDDLVPVRAAADLGSLAPEDLARPAFFPADEVDRAVAWDIARATTSIDVYCAFLGVAPTRKWLNPFSERIRAGVRVTVHTRPADPASREERLVGELRAAGCEVIPRDRMHEKVLIVDDRVLWHGSLNLLAHSGSTDLMMRVTDPTSCERVKRIVDRAQMDRPARKPPAATHDNGVRPGQIHDGRLYLDVSFAEKDQAKRAAKARWDAALKLWHVPADTPRHLVERWLPDQGNPTR
ncbi:AAA domain-containing protein [Actinomadura harenae]|uniref:AAA domain-containing protein n=1 Tax=Actinomadura harenae TaxID=2483351 RepID=UPI001F2BDCCA|nr:AAA domain-containing protein [Actinomadura harenae]